MILRIIGINQVYGGFIWTRYGLHKVVGYEVVGLGI